MTVTAEAITAAQDAIPRTWVDGDHWQPVLSRREIRKLLEAAVPFLAEDGWDAARDRATEANEARRDEAEHILRALGEHKEILARPAEGELIDAIWWRHVADLLRKETTDAA